jgi:vacuolar-type H+-ATPase subunit I/STV1
MTVMPVIFATVFGIAAGAVVYGVLGRVVARPVQLFRIVGVLVLVLSFGSPFSIPDAPVGMIAALLLMHIVAGVAAIGVLTTQAAKP